MSFELPRDLYTVDDVVDAELTARTAGGDGPVLVHVVRGFVDAGQAGRLAVEHLRETLPMQRLVTFRHDELIDYRARRPTMTFDVNRWASYEEPELAVELGRDLDGVPFLLLHGVEPDIRWEAWVAAVREVIERFAVRLSVGLYGIPMGVPHSRPLGVTAHGTRADLVADHPTWFGSVQVPASVSSLLELRLGEAGHDAIGFAVHVPHYLTQSTLPGGAQVGLDHIERVTGLDLGSEALTEAAREALEEVDRQVAASEEVAAVVRALEEQYDAFDRARGRTNLLAEEGELPTAEELGAQFERFLAEQRDD